MHDILIGRDTKASDVSFTACQLNMAQWEPFLLKERAG
jgi:hypothetical protein